MAKICFPHPVQGEFKSLEEVVRSDFTLVEIVRYNVYYRDYLREFGIRSLINKLIEEVPRLRKDGKALYHLHEWWQREQYIAPYDIQCYNIQDVITVLGHIFSRIRRYNCASWNHPQGIFFWF